MYVSDANWRRIVDPGYGVYPEKDFDGVWEVLYPNGQLKFRGAYKNGKELGQHLCYWENGVVAEVSFWDEGFVYGTVLKFREDGSKQAEEDWGEYGGRTKSWTARIYDTNSQLAFVTVRKNDQVIAEWTRPDLREYTQIEPEAPNDCGTSAGK